MSNGPLEQQQPPKDTGPFPRVFSNSRYLEESHRLAFQKVWDGGLSNAALPEPLEKVREKYDMLGPEYNEYWKFTVGSQLFIPGSKKNAVDELKAIEQRKVTEGTNNDRRELRKKHRRFKMALGRVFEEMWKSNPEHEGQPGEVVAEQIEKQGSKLKAQSDGGSDVEESGGINHSKEKSGSMDDFKQDAEDLLDELEAKSPGKQSDSAYDTKQLVEELLHDVDWYTPRKKSLLEREQEKSLSNDIFRLQRQMPLSGQTVKGTSREPFSFTDMRPTVRTTQEKRKRIAETKSEHAAWREMTKDQRKADWKLASLLGIEKKQLSSHTAHERTTKLRLLEQQRLDIMARKRDLLLRLKSLNMAEREDIKKKKQEELLAHREKHDPVQLGNILDQATRKAEARQRPIAEDSLENMMYGEGKTLSAPRLTTLARSPTEESPIIQSAEASLPRAVDVLTSLEIGETQSKTQDTNVQPGLDQSILPAKSDALYTNVPASGEIYINDNFTVTLNADIIVLQYQVAHLELLLRSSYPRIDAAPFLIEASTNRQTLQTWLKILASRYKSRFNEKQDEGETDQQVKSIMDHMVRDQNLSNAAAERMAEKWKETFENRKVRERNYSDSKAEEKPEVAVVDAPKVETSDHIIGIPKDGPHFSKAEAGDADRLAAYQRRTEDFVARHAEFKPKAKVLRNFVSKSGEEPAVSRKNKEKDNVDEPEEALRKLANESPNTPTVPKWTMEKDHRVSEPEAAWRITRFAAKGEAVDEQPRESLDLDEWNVGGMGFLHNDKPVTHDQTPKSAPRKTETWSSGSRRAYSTSSRPPLDPSLAPKDESAKTSTPTPNSTTGAKPPALPHLTPTGSAHMVSVSAKAHTVRTAIAVGTVYFSNPIPLGLIKSNSLKKGDVLSVSRIAGIMAAKKCPDLIPLCHPISLTHVGVELKVIPPSSSSDSNRSQDEGPQSIINASAANSPHGAIMIESKVSCTGPTGVEMEALTSVMGTALSVVDMCKAVDKFQRIGDVRVVLKEGGKSGVWSEEGWVSFQVEEGG